MRIVLFATPDLALPLLDSLHEHYGVVAVVCNPDRPAGRKRILQPPSVKRRAKELGIPVHQPQALHDGVFVQWLQDQEPDVCALAAYGRILRQEILDVPEHGFLNMHPSLLPKYRGPSPIQSAVLHGDTETGISIIRLTAEIDAGDILLQRVSPIYPEDNTGTLTQRLAQEGANLFIEALELLEKGHAVFSPQDAAQATYCRMFTKEDGRLDWKQSAFALHNRVRAANPWPMAYTPYSKDILRIHRTAVCPDASDSTPGTVVAAGDEGIFVAAGEGQLVLLEIQAPGRCPLDVAAFRRGRPILPGDRFE